jgi:hypothetical protein
METLLNTPAPSPTHSDQGLSFSKLEGITSEAQLSTSEPIHADNVLFISNILHSCYKGHSRPPTQTNPKMGLLATKRSSQKLPEEKVTSNSSRSEVTTMDQMLQKQSGEGLKPSSMHATPCQVTFI